MLLVAIPKKKGRFAPLEQIEFSVSECLCMHVKIQRSTILDYHRKATKSLISSERLYEYIDQIKIDLNLTKTNLKC